MKFKKYIILLITISFPVLLYLFLRFYGQNEYDLPYFFKDGVEVCEAAEPIRLSNFDLNRTGSETKTVATFFKGQTNIVLFPNAQLDNQPLKNELNRAMATFADRLKIDLHAFVSEDSSENRTEIKLNQQTIKYHILGADRFQFFQECLLGLPTPDIGYDHPFEDRIDKARTVVLLDDSAYIRGYYDVFETKEVDRLVLELEILLSNK